MANVSYFRQIMALFDNPTPRQRKAGVIAAFSLLAPIAAYLIGQAWVSGAMETDPVPQGAMVRAYLLFAPIALIAVPSLFFSLAVIVVDEIGKRKRR
jgi:hypothetical protein